MTNWVILKKSGKATTFEESYSFYNVLEAIANTDYNSYRGTEFFYDEPVKLFQDGIEIQFPKNIRSYACEYVTRLAEAVDDAETLVKGQYKLGEDNEPS